MKEILKKSGSMIVWQAITLALSFLSSVWIARCLGPEELGRSGFVVATGWQIVLFLNVCPNTFAVRYLKERENSDEATSLIITSRVLISVVYLVLLGLWMISGTIPGDWTNLVLLGFSIPILLAFQPLWLHQSLENQSAQYRSSATAAAASCVYVFLFIRPGGIAEQDLVSRLANLFVAVSVGWILTKKGNPLRFVCPTRVKEALSLIWESKVLFAIQFVIYIYVSLEMPLLGYLSSIKDLGLYRTATQLVIAANTFLVMLPLLYYPRFIVWRKESAELLWRNQKRIFGYLVLTVIPAAVVIWTLGPFVLSQIFGEEFAPAGRPFSILLCSKLVVLLHGVFGWGLYAAGRDLVMLCILSSVAVLSLSLNLILLPRFGMMAAASVNLVSETVILALTFITVCRLKGRAG